MAKKKLCFQARQSWAFGGACESVSLCCCLFVLFRCVHGVFCLATGILCSLCKRLGWKEISLRPAPFCRLFQNRCWCCCFACLQKIQNSDNDDVQKSREHKLSPELVRMNEVSQWCFFESSVKSNRVTKQKRRNQGKKIQTLLNLALLDHKTCMLPHSTALYD